MNAEEIMIEVDMLLQKRELYSLNNRSYIESLENKNVSILSVSVCTRNGTKRIYKTRLDESKKVEELFDYCQILEGYITRQGWEFLIKYYGYNRLFEIDKRSGWLCERTDGSIEEYIECVEYEIKSIPE